MKKYILMLCTVASQLVFSQKVYLSEVKTMAQSDSKDLVKLDSVHAGSATYLASIMIDGKIEDEIELFKKIYNQAKSVGSNSYYVQVPEQLNTNNSPKLLFQLFSADEKVLPHNSNEFIFMNSSLQSRKVRLNDRKISINPKSYIIYKMKNGEVVDVSTLGLLGSRIRLANTNQIRRQSFLVSGFNAGSSSNSTPGISLKSGDLVKLEHNFADFLMAIYSKEEVR